jgi:uncharacterized protein (TIGR02118 family)
MIKHISILRRNKDVTPEEFRKYWTEVHAPLVRQGLPGLRKYVGNFPVAAGRDSGWGLENRGTIHDCDLIVELHFDDMAALQAAMLGPGWLNDTRRNSSATVMDYTQMIFTIAEEHIVPLDQ